MKRSVIVYFDQEAQKLTIDQDDEQLGRRGYATIELASLKKWGRDKACENTGEIVLLGILENLDGLMDLPAPDEKEIQLLEYSCLPYRDFELDAFTRTQQGELEPFSLSIKAPKPDSEGFGCYSEVLCPRLLGKGIKQIYGVDGHQAYRLPRELVRDLLVRKWNIPNCGEWDLVDASGTKLAMDFE